MTERCDGYSFGVVLLELLMGKHPGDVNDVINLLKPEVTIDDARHLYFVDPNLPVPTDEEAKELDRMIQTAFRCLDNNPIARPSMQEVVKSLGYNML